MNEAAESADTGKKSKVLVFAIMGVVVLGIITYIAYTRLIVSEPARMLEEADKLVIDKKFDEALKIYIEIIDKYPSTNEAIRAGTGAGNIYFGKKDYDKAIPYFEKRLNAEQSLLDKDVTFVVNSKMGHVYFVKNDYDKALQYLNQALILAKDTKNPKGDLITANTQIGLVYINKGEYDQAVSYFKTVFDLEPKSALIEFHLAKAYYLNKEYDKAETHLTHFLSLDPKDPERVKAARGYLEAIKKFKAGV